MAEPTPGAPEADRNLLFGILALQMDLIGRDALIAAMHAWVLAKSRPLGDILIEQHALQPAERDAIDGLVRLHLERHGGDIEQSMTVLHIPTPVQDELHRIGDGDAQIILTRLSTPPVADAPAAMPSTMPEQRAGHGLRYHVLRPHGKGGLGEVFIARDQELNRQVALKEIREEHADDPQSRSRFVREAEITGRLEHPGIVPVYGLGQYGDGRPFYAMRFIQGETLKDAITRYHQASGGRKPPDPAHEGADPPPSQEFERRALLTRFVAVCNAVAYAHSRGVLHRDLKPSNVMLCKYGETFIVDWGLAKAVGHESGRGAREGTNESLLVLRPADAAAETQMGAALGTPAYMSPEQASGRLDQLGPASDIYSLGAVLYAVLTGRPPIEGKDSAEALKKAQRGEWPPPGHVHPAVPPALDSVCRKALALRPEQRYGTALELAADVERWLADEPVEAYPEPLGRRLARWGRRHRPIVTGAAALLLTAVAALSVGIVLLGQANTQIQRSSKELANANTSLASSNAELDKANKKLKRTSINAAMFTSALMNQAGPKQAISDQTLAAASVRLWKEILEDNPKDAFSRNELANALYYQGVLFRKSGTPTEQRRCWLESAAVSEALVKDKPDEIGYAANLGNTYYNLGVLASIEQKSDEEIAWMQKAIQTLQPLRSRSHDEKARWLLMSAYQGRGEVYAERKELQQALADFSEAVALAVAGEKPGLELGAATARAQAGQHKEAADEADAVLQNVKPTQEHLKAAAAVFALAAGAVQKDKKLSDAERERLEARYAERAIDLLKQAHGRGAYTTPEAIDALEKNPDFATLKTRKDFQDYVRELKQELKNRKP
jgi:serine/threonine-protein kinase